MYLQKFRGPFFLSFWEGLCHPTCRGRAANYVMRTTWRTVLSILLVILSGFARNQQQIIKAWYFQLSVVSNNGKGIQVIKTLTFNKDNSTPAIILNALMFIVFQFLILFYIIIRGLVCSAIKHIKQVFYTLN